MFYRRKLPHWHPDLTDETPLFVTWRLTGSIPRVRLPQRPAGTAISGGRAFIALDRETDKALVGPVWLTDPRIAAVVADALRYGDTERGFYSLATWVIMPNHVHLVFYPKTRLPVITRWLKGSTARKANLLLGRTGEAFWQDESFDHRVRDERELERLIRYVEQNPVAAGLVSDSKDWPWSSASWQAKAPAPLQPGESGWPT